MVGPIERPASPAVIENLARVIVDPTISLPDRYKVLFSLRNVTGPAATAALLAALTVPHVGDLFRHDVAFCLGQRRDPAAIETLLAILRDESDHSMVRHEAAEALASVGSSGSGSGGRLPGPDEEGEAPTTSTNSTIHASLLDVVRAHVDDPVREVAETCKLALEKIAYTERLAKGEEPPRADENPYYSVDPTPAYPKATPLSELRAILLDEGASMFDRYQALFGIRNRGGDEAVDVLGECFGAKSALLKHEVAYVLGQLARPHR